MEALKFVVVLLVVVFVQVLGALGTPLSGEEDDGDILTVENWQVKETTAETMLDIDLWIFLDFSALNLNTS